jgi:hypothetical protein
MDDTTKQPAVFANKVICQMIQHMVAEDMVIDRKDYLAIRVVFRKCGGSWAKFVDGDLPQFKLLKDVITAWGQMPGRHKSSDQLI